MTNLRDVTAYLCKNYPYKTELSKARLTKLVYLADWFSVKSSGNQITGINWYFDNFGPYVADVYNMASLDKDTFKVEKTINAYGKEKVLISLSDDFDNSSISIGANEKEILDSVIDETKGMYWDKFIAYIYSTSPIAKSDRYQFLKLKDFLR
jgi:hypothetical protein